MLLTLANFKQQIDDTILQRARQYHRSGHIVDLEEVDEGIWSAEVKGTETYNVDISQEDSGALSYECTCPYDLGPVCKHVAAVLYAIEETFPEYANAKPKKPHKKRQTREDKVLEILKRLSHEELVDLLAEIARNERQLANMILARHSEGGSDKKLYVRMVKDALNLGKGQHGYIDYWGSGRAAKGVHNVLRRAEDLLQQGEPTQSIPVIQAVIETVVPAVEQADDSNGELGNCINVAFDYLDKAIEMMPPASRESVLEYCLSEALDEKYAGWDWGWDLAQVAANLVKTPEQRTALFTTLDQMVADQRTHHEEIRATMFPRRDDADFPDYDAEHAEEIKLMVIERLDGPKAVEEFLKGHVEVPRFRHALVQYYIDRGNLAEAKRLCNEYLEASDSRLPGIQLGFQALLLEIARKGNDNTEARNLARMLFVKTGEFTFYDLLKKSIPSGEWDSALQQLIPEIKGYYSDYVVPEIYRREERWDDLLATIQKANPGIVEGYCKQLEPRFPAEMCDIYEKFALDTLSIKANRQGYQAACQYFRRMNKLGQKERVENLVQTLTEMYSNRPALLDELKKL